MTAVKRLPRPLQLAIADAARRRHPSLSSLCPCVTHEDLLCSICFDILSFPVTLPCGHNFDRGCILTAWAHEASSSSPTARAATEARATAAAHLCPLCRQQTEIQELQVNLLLKELIASLYPTETQVCTRDIATVNPFKWNGAHHQHSSVGFRRRPNLRTFSSFVYVCAASITDPPGFVLAVLLLLVLLATACNPQPATAPPAASAMVMFDTMDRVCNGLSLMIHRISMHMDQMDQVSPWIRL
ncbi:Zinc finger, RING/FYVE/PHD-type [Phytophthora cactorum]|nr:Zinc finger, RING/FYVE/PHD-type [Phytophthora cactorum]